VTPPLPVSIDTIKTRIQRASRVEGETALSRVMKVAGEMFAQEGPSAFWKGITPRVARVAPGAFFRLCAPPPPAFPSRLSPEGECKERKG
jgi:hypothetical protein